MSNLWTEKYRPSKFKDFKGHENIVKRVKAFVKNKNIPHMLFSGPAGLGKCVVGETPILLGDGKLCNISEAYKNNAKTVYSLNKEGKICKGNISYFYKGKSKELIHIKTRFGSNIKVTPEHPFLVLRNGYPVWVESKDLKENERLGSPEVLNFKKRKFNFKIPKSFSEEGNYIYYRIKNRKSCYMKKIEPTKDFYYWLGLVFGDGHFRNAGIRFYNTSKYLRDVFRDISVKVFGDKLEIIEVFDKCPYVEIRKGTTIIKFLEENIVHKIQGKKSYTIDVPEELFFSDVKKISGFIRGIYETDGSTYESCIEISSMSKNLLIKLRYLLLKFKIHSRIIKNRLMISGSNNLKKFNKYIKPNIKVPLLDRIDNTNMDVLEIPIADIRHLSRNLGIPVKKMYKKYNHLFDRAKGSRIRIKKFYEEISNLSKTKIKRGLDLILLLENIDKLDVESEKVIGLLDKKTRKILMKDGIERGDRLKEYYDRKREPNLTNYLKILKKLIYVKSCSETEYKKISQLLLIRSKLVEGLSMFNISYNEISVVTNIHGASVNYILNNEGLSLSGLKNLKQICICIKSCLEKRIYNERIIHTLENLEFLRNSEMIWDSVSSIKKIDGEEVYDLNVEQFHNFVGGNSPLILHNTTLAIITVKELFGEDWNKNYLETNASEERGIDVVRNKIKDFARTRAIGTDLPKIIYLDEADALTRDAQNALRRTMEKYSGTARFILACNYSSKIIDPIQSRCSVFRFKPLEDKNVKEIIDSISKEEKLKIDEKAVKALQEISNGDVRRVTNVLQSCASVSKEINEDLIYEIVSIARPKEILDVLKIAVGKNFIKSRDLLLEVMLKHGLSGLDVVKQIQKEIWNLNIEDEKKVELVEQCGEIEFRMVEGSDEFVQLESLIASFTITKK